MKCPKCREEIGYLVNLESGSQRYYLNKKGEYMRAGFLPNDIVNEYLCPECDAILFNNEVDALNFVKEDNNGHKNVGRI